MLVRAGSKRGATYIALIQTSVCSEGAHPVHGVKRSSEPAGPESTNKMLAQMPAAQGGVKMMYGVQVTLVQSAVDKSVQLSCPEQRPQSSSNSGQCFTQLVW